MGNEDIVVSKNINENQDYKSDIVEMNSPKQRRESMPVENLALPDKDGRVDFVQVLPMEVIEEVFLYLNPRDLAACTAVSSSWRDAVNSNKIWGRLCEKSKWKDEFDPKKSNFFRAHKQFRVSTHTSNSFSPMCHKRIVYNKHSWLQRNWRHGKCIVLKLSSNKTLRLFEPVSCDGSHIVIQEQEPYSENHTLAVWNLDNVPSHLCKLYLPSAVHKVESVSSGFGTIAVAQAWVIIVYHLQNTKFKKAFEKSDLADLQPKSKLPMDIKRLVPHLKVTEDYIICVPNHSHSTVDFLPIYFWDRKTGVLKHTLSFDSMYYQISNAVWFKDSCYLSLTNKKKKSYQVVEFGTKTAAWEAFAQSVAEEVEQVVVGEQYVLAVVKTSNLGLRQLSFSRHDEHSSRELHLWDRSTGLALKTFDAQGRGFQFVDDYLMYYDSSKVTVKNPNTPTMCNEFKVSGTISAIRAAPHPSTLVIIKTGCYIEVWDWGLCSRLYSISTKGNIGSRLWCDERRVITYNHVDDSSYNSSYNQDGMLLLGYW